jgi:hypothetical protein
LSTITDIIIFDAYKTTTNNNGDNRSLYLNPHKVLKKLEGDPLMRMENHIIDMQCTIQSHHLPPKPHLNNKYNKLPIKIKPSLNPIYTTLQVPLSKKKKNTIQVP